MILIKVHLLLEDLRLGGDWLPQLVEHATLDPGVMSLSPTLGEEFTFKKIKLHLKRATYLKSFAYDILVTIN